MSEKAAVKTMNKRAGRPSQARAIWRRFKKNRLALAGLCVFGVILFFSVFANFFADYQADVVNQNLYQRFESPGREHLMGTDAFGRDVFAKLIFGGRISLLIAIVVMSSSMIIGTVIGSVVGYYGGRLDAIVMRIVDVFLAVPSILLSVTIVAALGTGVPVLMVALTVGHIPTFTRIVRSTVLQVKCSDYIDASIAYGSKQGRIIFRHVLPNAIGPIIVQGTLNLAGILISIASLGFIGLGVPSPQPEWGTMLAESKPHMLVYPYLMLFPGIAIALSVLSLNLIGDGLRDALDPKLKR